MLKYRQIYYVVTLLLVFGLFSSGVFAQNYQVKLMGLPKGFHAHDAKIDSATLILFANKQISQLRKSGYWLASLDSSVFYADTVRLYFFAGRQFDEINLSVYLNPTEEAYVSERRPSIREENISAVNKRMDEVVKYYENNGYPFASIQIDSSRVVGEKINLYLSVDPGMLIKFDTLAVSPEGLLKDKFVARYLGLNYGKYYSQIRVDDIANKLENIPAVSLVHASNSFRLHQSKISLELKPEKVNYFDGILGFIPSAENSKKLEFTGELNLSLKNLFQSAKQFEFHWEKYTRNSQSLNTHYIHPVFLGMPLDLFLGYDQLKQDTLFSNRTLKLAFDYYPSGRTKLRTSYENLLGNELNDGSGQSGNFRIDYYGLGLEFWRLDNRQNPKQGLAFQLDTKVGFKEIEQDTTAQMDVSQYQFSTRIQYYQKVKSRSVIYLAGSAGWMQSDQLYLNDLYRLGGLRSIRGFNENEFFASQYAYSNLEWRFYLEDNSYLVAFVDQAILTYDIVTGDLYDNPSGIGVGMQFKAAGGNFLMLYGLGRRKSQAFSFDSSKIHFGYSALF
ncbi:BamA/TamA family outer membrane protein [Reichenbachiella agarivorans]|uniref:BamA/TamA family outer membrane protein n=1 Tax=Reichenbachiella agarivorans TaxID=2979464 RepID=A0ABY6CTB9_9BACT|nr:BamA/TamA family outer membrane protein [Reichenbachiella agarivorans]UXP33751.1 BamA/TamA family outer membrane protein [Reichenbachiella agarivorans]